MKVVVDIETMSAADLRKLGSLNYAKDSSTFIRCMAWKYEGQEAIGVINPILIGKMPSKVEEFKAFYKDMVEGNVKLIAHNAVFEKDVFNHKLEDFYEAVTGEFLVPSKKYKNSDFWCTMVLSAMCRGPGALAKASEYFGCKEQKGGPGQDLMKSTHKILPKANKCGYKTTKGQKMPFFKVEGGYVATNNHVELEVFDYCIQDVVTTAELYEKIKVVAKKDLGSFYKYSIEGYKITQDMNERGLKVDLDRAETINGIYEDVLKARNALTMEHFGIENSARKTAVIKAFNDNGYELPSMDKIAVFTAMDKQEEHVLNKVLIDYRELTRLSLKKASWAIRANDNGRLYNVVSYCGASETGRWSSKGFQFQNLPRPSVELVEAEAELEEFNRKQKLNKVTPEAAQSALRSLIECDEAIFAYADLSQIECRLALYTTGHIDAVTDMHNGKDIYKELAAKIYSVKDVTDEQRRLGKESILSLQFGTGVVKFKENNFRKYNIQLSDLMARKAHTQYHIKYNKIKPMWYKMGDTIPKKEVEFRLKLATGRYLNYGKLRQSQGGYGGNMEYYSAEKRFWKSMWGGSLFQHKIQAEARDIMLFKMIHMVELGYKIALTVHDEVVFDLHKDSIDIREKFEKDWNNAGNIQINEYFPGLLLDSEVKYNRRYYK